MVITEVADTSRASKWIAGAACLGAPLSIAWLIVRYGVNVAVQDQIRIGAFLVRNHDRFFPALADLFAQHNESRKIFPRLIFFYLARLTHWNVKYEMAVSLGNPADIAGASADLAELLRHIGRLAEALRACDEGLAAYPASPRHLQTVRYEILRTWGRFDEAMDALDRRRAEGAMTE